LLCELLEGATMLGLRSEANRLLSLQERIDF
jgi:hypothetical protein